MKLHYVLGFFFQSVWWSNDGHMVLFIFMASSSKKLFCFVMKGQQNVPLLLSWVMKSRNSFSLQLQKDQWFYTADESPVETMMHVFTLILLDSLTLPFSSYFKCIFMCDMLGKKVATEKKNSGRRSILKWLCMKIERKKSHPLIHV